MKNTLLLMWMLIALFARVNGQSVGIGTMSPDASAQLEISTTTKGLLIPRMNTSSISGIINPAKGLMVYDSTLNELMVNMGTADIPIWRSIASNSSWNLNGNTGTLPASHFIGTADDKPLQFRVNNKLAGKIDSAGFRTFYGFRAGNSTTGVSNTAFGYKSAYSLTSGQNNTAVGTNALLTSSVGNNNTAIGSEALMSSTAAYHNVAVGHQASRSNTTGGLNTAVGTSACTWNSTGWFNTAVGALAMGNNSTGNDNTALGADALRWTNASSYNTAVGSGAGESNNLGWNNTLIGADCNVWSSGLFNSVGVGNATAITASSQARIGNSSTSSIGGYANWSNISDGRYKKDIREDIHGLDFIMKLRPVTYHLDVTKLRNTLHEPDRDMKESGMETAIAEKESMVQSGFIAQEVEQAALELGFDFSGVDKPKNENDLYGLRYAEFVVPLVKAVQELAEQAGRQQLEIQQLRLQNALLMQNMEALALINACKE